MSKVVIIALFSVLVLYTGVLSAPQQNGLQTDLLIEKLLQVRDTTNGTTDDTTVTDNTGQNIIGNIIDLVIKAILGIAITAGCSIITPYLTLIKLFQSTVLEGIALILSFAASVVSTFFPDLASVVTQASSAVTSASTTVANIITYISDAGCSV